MSDKVTSWELRLKDLVLGPMSKLMNLATGTQNKINGVQGGLNKLSQMSNSMGRDFKRNYSQLDNLLENLKRRQEQAFNVKHIQAYQKMIDKTRQEMERLNRVTAAPEASKWQKFKSGISGMGSQIPGIGGMLGMATNPYTLVAGAALMIGTASTELAMNFETGMAKINATAQLPTETLGKLKTRLKDIGSQSGGNFELMPSAYEKILSQTNDVNLSLDVLETSVKGAKAGFADIDTVAGSLGKSLSAIGSATVSANDVMDTLLRAKAVGGGEFNDFAQYAPSLISLGKSVGVGWKDAIGLFSVMTANGIDAAKSATLVENAFSALSKDKVLDGLQGYGIDVFYKKGDKKGMRRNIVEIVKDMSKYMQNVTDEQKTKFLLDISMNDIQAKQAFESLITDGKKFETIMGDVNHALGETDKQLAATANTARTWGDLSDKFKNIGESMGTYLIPVIDWFLIKIQGAIDMFDYFVKDLKSGFTVTGNLKAEKVAQNEAISGAFKKKYGMEAPKNYEGLDAQQTYFLYNLRHGFDLKDNLSNKIVAEQPKGKGDKGKPMSPLDNANTGGDSGKASTSSVSGSGVSGSRSLTQNLYITINIKKAADIDDGTLKRKLTDLIVDSGRDGLVTIGA